MAVDNSSNTLYPWASSSSGSGSSLPVLPTHTGGSTGSPSPQSFPTTVDSLGRSQPAGGGGSYAGGGALPGTNKNMITPTMDPTLTNEVLGYLRTQAGQGLPAFNQSVGLPSGGTTAPGQLTAGLNPILKQLQDFMTGKGGPESLPGVLPMWQSEMEAMQGPIEQNLANLREQFGARGALGSSELGSASMDYLAQTSADEMALLTSATMSSLPNMLQSGMDIQGIDQSAIQNAYKQFMTDLPQNNPMMGDMMSAAFTHPGQSYQKQPTFLDSLLGNAGGILKTAGEAASSAFPGMPGWMSILMGA